MLIAAFLSPADAAVSGPQGAQGRCRRPRQRDSGRVDVRPSSVRVETRMARCRPALGHLGPASSARLLLREAPPRVDRNLPVTGPAPFARASCLLGSATQKQTIGCGVRLPLAKAAIGKCHGQRGLQDQGIGRRRLGRRARRKNHRAIPTKEIALQSSFAAARRAARDGHAITISAPESEPDPSEFAEVGPITLERS